MTNNKWQQWLKAYQINPDFPDERFALRTCILAYQAVQQGNFGVGCLIIDGKQNIVAEGHNQVFKPYFRSDLHGEMVVMNKFEEANPSLTSMKGYTLYTSLESCPMCMARLIAAGCEKILYVAPDKTGGMVHLRHNLPEVWQQLAASPRQYWGVANCSEDLRNAAYEIVMLNAETLNKKLFNR